MPSRVAAVGRLECLRAEGRRASRTGAIDDYQWRSTRNDPVPIPCSACVTTTAGRSFERRQLRRRHDVRSTNLQSDGTADTSAARLFLAVVGDHSRGTPSNGSVNPFVGGDEKSTIVHWRFGSFDTHAIINRRSRRRRASSGSRHPQHQRGRRRRETILDPSFDLLLESTQVSGVQQYVTLRCMLPSMRTIRPGVTEAPAARAGAS